MKLRGETMDFYSYLERKSKKDKVKKIVVGAIITNQDGKVFLAKRKKDDFMGGFYEIPGGNGESKETIYDTLVREIKEETNLDIKRVKSYINYFDYVSDKGKKSRQFNFVVEVKSLNNIVLTEHDCYEWLDLDELEKIKKISDEVKEVLLIYRFILKNNN